MKSMSNRSTVLVYDGEGAEPECLEMLKTALNRHVDTDQHEVRIITPQDIIEQNWTEDCSLIAIGGGYDLGFINALGKEGTRVIHDFVWNGGAYLGICAGGYFGCSAIEFDKAGPLEVVGDRDLKFYPGSCIGPAYPGFEYRTKKGAVAADIHCNLPRASNDQAMLIQNTLRIHTDGGGYFISSSISPGSKAPEIVATFCGIPGEPAAIVKCGVGEKGGRAILSGVHFEFCPEMFDPSNPNLNKHVLPALFQSDKDRQVLLTRLLQELGIQTRL